LQEYFRSKKTGKRVDMELQAKIKLRCGINYALRRYGFGYFSLKYERR